MILGYMHICRLYLILNSSAFFCLLSAPASVSSVSKVVCYELLGVGPAATVLVGTATVPICPSHGMTPAGRASYACGSLSWTSTLAISGQMQMQLEDAQYTHTPPVPLIFYEILSQSQQLTTVPCTFIHDYLALRATAVLAHTDCSSKQRFCSTVKYIVSVHKTVSQLSVLLFQTKKIPTIMNLNREDNDVLFNRKTCEKIDTDKKDKSMRAHL